MQVSLTGVAGSPPAIPVLVLIGGFALGWYHCIGTLLLILISFAPLIWQFRAYVLYITPEQVDLALRHLENLVNGLFGSLSKILAIFGQLLDYLFNYQIGDATEQGIGGQVAAVEQQIRQRISRWRAAHQNSSGYTARSSSRHLLFPRFIHSISHHGPQRPSEVHATPRHLRRLSSLTHSVQEAQIRISRGQPATEDAPALHTYSLGSEENSSSFESVVTGSCPALPDIAQIHEGAPRLHHLSDPINEREIAQTLAGFHPRRIWNSQCFDHS